MPTLLWQSSLGFISSLTLSFLPFIRHRSAARNKTKRDFTLSLAPWSECGLSVARKSLSLSDPWPQLLYWAAEGKHIGFCLWMVKMLFLLSDLTACPQRHPVEDKWRWVSICLPTFWLQTSLLLFLKHTHSMRCNNSATASKKNKKIKHSNTLLAGMSLRVDQEKQRIWTQSCCDPCVYSEPVSNRIILTIEMY